MTLALTGPRFALVEPEGQAGVVSGWGRLLATCAAAGIRRLQLTERTVPDPGAAQWRWLADAATPAAPSVLSAYAEHLGAVVGAAVRHEAYLTVVFDGGDDLAERAGTAGARLVGLLEGAGVVGRPVGAPELSDLLRRMVDPDFEALAGVRPAGHEPAARLAPRGWRSRWGSVLTDGAHHACFEASELPRTPVGPAWAWPLVAGDGAPLRRTLSLHIELAPPAAGLRRAERAVLAQVGEEAARARWGFRSGARRAAATEATLARESELAAGFADARFSLLLAVATQEEGELEAVCRRAQAQAAQAQVELGRLWGRQAEALVATLPLGLLRLGGGWG